MHQSSILRERKAEERCIKNEATVVNESETTDANFSFLIQKYLPSVFIAEDSYENGVKVIYAKTLYRISALLLAFVALCSALISLSIDYLIQQTELTVPLLILCVPVAFSLLWLVDKSRNPLISLAILGVSLTLFASYLLVCNGPSDGSTMVWISVFPTIMVFSMGLRYGTYAFAVLYLFMLLLFQTSFGSIMAVAPTETMQTRVLIVCLGTFCFAWCLEFARQKTNFSLLMAAHRIEQNSFTDPLTGLGNRRDFDRSLAWTMARVKRTSVPYSLAVIDIDHFKKVNDTYGHAIGDEVLKFVAKSVESQIRTADRLFRWGGEEFAIIMPTTKIDKAIIGAERVRKYIENTAFDLDDVHIEITISIGIYSGAEDGDPAHPLHVADTCLYEAKSTGRNKVVAGE